MSEERFGKYYKEYEMEDGTKVKMILTNKHLIALKTVDKETYSSICGMIFKGLNDEEDIEKIVKVLYGAYVCANMEEHMDYDTFLDCMNPSIVYNIKIAGKLIGTSKK